MTISLAAKKKSVPTLGPWQVVAALWLVACLNYMARNMVTTMHGSLVEAFPMTEAEFGLLTSAFLCVYGALSPFAGFLSDRFGRSRVIVTALLVWSAVTWLTGYAANFQELLAMRVLMAVSEVFYIPAGLALIADYHRGATRGLATGIHQTALGAGGMAASIGGWLAETHGWRFAFVAVGLPSLVYGLVLAGFLRDAPREEGPGVAVDLRATATSDRADAGIAAAPKVRLGAALGSLLRTRSYLLVVGCTVCVDGFAWIMVGWMPTYLREHFGLGQGAAGFSATAYLTIASTIGLIAGGSWSDRWSRTNRRSRVFVSVIGLGVAIPGILLAAHAGTLWLAMGGMIVIGLFRAFWGANLMPLFCLVSDPRYRATGYGIINTASTFTGGLGIFLAGILRDRHVPMAQVFDLLAVGQVIAIGLLLLIRIAV